MTEQEQGERPSCIICGDGRVLGKMAALSGGRWPICLRCAGIGGELKRGGALEEVRHCLHLFGMECEAVGDRQHLFGSERSWVGRLRKRLSDGELRRACSCDGCNGRPVAGAIPELHAHFGMKVETFADTMPLIGLRTMRPAERLVAEDGSIWRAEDEIARRAVEAVGETGREQRPGGLAERARPWRPGFWTVRHDAESGELIDVWQNGERRQLDAADVAARRYWRGLAEHGRGYLDGRYWVDEAGECHELVE